MSASYPAHGGGGLVHRTVPEMEKERMVSELKNGKVYRISDADLSVFYRIADGALSPLVGPMESEAFHRVLDQECIERNGKKYAWTIPLAFPIARAEADRLEMGETVRVENRAGETVGALKVTDVYPFDKNKYNASVYGTERTDHPGARICNDDPRDYLVGGPIWAFPQPKDPEFGEYMLTPWEARALFAKRGWERIVAFQTRNALHRAHEYALLYAAETLTRKGHVTGAVLNPLVGATKSDDVPADVRMRTYEALIQARVFGAGDEDPDVWKTAGYDFEDQLILIGLDMKMFYAGPREAVMHSIYRQNYGFTDLVVGRKHADAPYDDGTPIWGDFDAHEKFDALNGELLIRPVKVGFAAYFEEIGRVGLIDALEPKGYRPLFISGKEVRRKLQEGEEVDERIMRRPVAAILREFYRGDGKRVKIGSQKSSNVVWHAHRITREEREKQNGHKGGVIWLTGLPSSGKSTIANVLCERLFRMGCRAYVLDGDNIRHGLNGDLGFSPEDREENIRRIGEVAHLFADAGFIAITAFISPYRKDRDRARALNGDGEFVEVYVKAPLDVCEERDPKGMYKKAREGVIKDFTGVDSPYEEPVKPEVVVETDKLSVEESADEILGYLQGEGIL